MDQRDVPVGGPPTDKRPSRSIPTSPPVAGVSLLPSRCSRKESWHSPCPVPLSRGEILVGQLPHVAPTITVASTDGTLVDRPVVLVCATQRCGSTMVVEDMRNSGILGLPEEWFIPWQSEKTLVNWSRALTDVLHKASSANGVSAVKIMANQAPDVDACLRQALRSSAPTAEAGVPFAALRQIFAGAVWVRLRRLDVVEQAISRVMSRQTGINHATARPEDDHFAGNLARGLTSNYNAKAVYRFEAILSEVTAIILENLAWDRFFFAHHLKPLTFIYEDLVADPQMRHLDEMASALGLPEVPMRTPRKMVKLANDKNRAWKDQFFEDCETMRFRLPKT
jgi:LPS sulfotransferase NodH